MRTTVSITTLIVLLTTIASAQEWEAGAAFGIMSPQKEFKTSLGNNGYGITGYGGYAPQNYPYLAGLYFGYTVYGSESRREPFSPTIPDVTVTVDRTNSLILFGVLFRIQPNSGLFRPYLQGAAGLHYLFTTTSIKSENRVSSESVASSTNESDAAFSYGGGGGLGVCVYRADESDPSRSLQEVIVHVGARYEAGGEASYLKEGSVQIVNGRAVYQTITSKTDLMLFEIGASFRF